MTKLFFSAGDLSGDVHCAMVCRELLQRHPDWEIFALGGKQLKSSGAQLLGDTSELGVIGFASALAILPQTLKLRSKALKWLKQNSPDAIVLCDWGGFNSRLLPDLKKLGIPILFYFPPRSWQKRGQAGLSVAPLCDRIATPFPWSAKRLNEVGGHAEWVGHPILETASAGLSREEVRREFGIGSDEKMVTLLPGSRSMERKYIAPHVAGAIEILQAETKARYFVAASSGTSEKMRPLFPDPVQFVENRTFDLLKACDAAVVKSGTSTLEAAVAGAPQVIVYEIPALLKLQVKLTGMRKKMRFVGMPNIILDREVATELLTEDCRAEKIAAATLKLLQSPEHNATMLHDYSLIREALGEKLPYTATRRTADMVEDLVSSSS